MKNRGLIVMLVLVGLLGIGAGACTSQQRAKEFGGSAKIQLPPGKKLVNVTWKETQLWYLTRDMLPSESPQSYTFQESSSFGLLEGTVTLVEQR